MFVLGNNYRRHDLHEMYGGQGQGGISTPSLENFILLFTGKTGQRYGYQDGWTEEGCFFYTGGEGQRGDMLFLRGNLAIRDHEINGKDIHLFESVRKGYVRYIGQMVCTGYHKVRAPDIDGNDRQAIIFELTPFQDFGTTIVSDNEDKVMWHESLSSLRERAISSSTSARSPSERRSLYRHRSNAIKFYVLKRANGSCEACRKDAPFRTHLGRPYLEPHHIRRLSDGGPDDPRWVIALCPNCHRRAHYGEDRSKFNQQLAQIVNDEERKIKEAEAAMEER